MPHRLFLKHGKPQYLRSDNGSEFRAKAFTTWLKAQGIKPVTILRGSQWENGYNERFKGSLRKELLNAEWFHSMRPARTAIKPWLKQYNTIRPH